LANEKGVAEGWRLTFGHDRETMILEEVFLGSNKVGFERNLSMNSFDLGADVNYMLGGVIRYYQFDDFTGAFF
jgi:hypothetical protein